MGSQSVLFINSLYPRFIKFAGIGSKPTSKETTFMSAQRSVNAMGIGTSDALPNALGRLGWDAEVVYANAYLLQELWARENGYPSYNNFWYSRGWRQFLRPRVRRMHTGRPRVVERMIQQIASLRPDVLFVQDMHLFDCGDLRVIRRWTGKVVGQCGVSLPSPAHLAQYDHIFSALPSNVHKVHAMGIPGTYLPHAFDTRILNLVKCASRDIDISFVGSFSKKHSGTIELLKSVANRVPTLQIYGPANPIAMRRFGLLSNYQGEAWGTDMYHVMCRSKVALNRHIDLAGPYAANMRLFEASGCGAAVLTESRINLSDILQPGTEAFTYTSRETAGDVAAAVLANQPKLARVAEAGQIRTIKEHSYEAQARTVHSILIDLN